MNQFFVALFTTFGMQKDDNIIFVCGCFRTRWYAKRWFPKDGVRRVEIWAKNIQLSWISRKRENSSRNNMHKMRVNLVAVCSINRKSAIRRFPRAAFSFWGCTSKLFLTPITEISCNVIQPSWLAPFSTANIKAVRETLWSCSVNKLSHIPKLQSVSAVYKNQWCQIWFYVLIELSALELPHPRFTQEKRLLCLKEHKLCMLNLYSIWLHIFL